MESADIIELLISRLVGAELQVDRGHRQIADAGAKISSLMQDVLALDDLRRSIESKDKHISEFRAGLPKLAMLYETTAELTRLLSLPRHGANRDAIAKQANTVNKALRDAYDHCGQLPF